MTDSSFTIKDYNSNNITLAADAANSVLTPYHLEAPSQRAALISAVQALPTGAATDAKVEAVRAALAGTIAVSASALPLPAGAATDAKVEAVRALLAGTVNVAGPLTAAQLSSANLATAAAQSTGNTSLATIASTVATDASVKATASADDLFAITPSDTASLLIVPKALYVLTTGNLAVRGTGSSPVTIPVTAGQIIPLRARYVYSTGTTATVVGLV